MMYAPSLKGPSLSRNSVEAKERAFLSSADNDKALQLRKYRKRCHTLREKLNKRRDKMVIDGHCTQQVLL